jgi:hypothetical protein
VLAGALASVLACTAGGLAAGPAQVASHPSSAPAPTQLNGVSAVSATNIWAVGDNFLNPGAKPLIVHLTGTHWAAASTPNPGGSKGYNQLNGVSAVSATNAWAVGRYSTADFVGLGESLILHWNGKGWTRTASPSPGKASGNTVLQAVKAVSATDAWAVGTYSLPGEGEFNQPLLLHWNGKSWTQVTSPNPGGATGTTALTGVAATAAGDVWVTGWYSTDTGSTATLILHWNGKTWTQVPSPSPGAATGGTQLLAVSAVSATNAWAAGSYITNSGLGASQSLILHWNGFSWKQVTSPSPGGTAGTATPAAVSAVSYADAWVVGDYTTSSSYGRSLTLRREGTSWAQVPSPDPSGTTRSTYLSGVAAISLTNAWAVGSYNNGTNSQSLILHWNGKSWSKVTSPEVAG